MLKETLFGFPLFEIKISIIIIIIIILIISIDYDIYASPDGTFGDVDEHGNWSGLIGELHNKRADIGIGSISVMAEREAVVDFTVP